MCGLQYSSDRNCSIILQYLITTETNGKNHHHLQIHKNYKTKFNKNGLSYSVQHEYAGCQVHLFHRHDKHTVAQT